MEVRDLGRRRGFVPLTNQRYRHFIFSQEGHI
jgi:hypothetical protein